MPAFSEWVVTLPASNFVSRALAEPISYLPPSAIALCFNYNLWETLSEIINSLPRATPNLRENPDEALTRKINRFLRVYDMLLKKRTGLSLRDTFFSPEKSCNLPFENYAYLGEKIPLEVITWRGKEDKVPTLFRMAYAICNDNPGNDHDFGLPFEEEVTKLYNETDYQQTSSIDVFSKPDGVKVRLLGSEPTSLGPSCFSDPTAESAEVRRNTLGDFLTFSKIQPESETAKFVTSNCNHPCYCDMSQEQFDYYIHWKQSFLRGTHLDTDSGYINLYLSELVNVDTPFTLPILQDLRDTYEGENREQLTIFGSFNQDLISATLVDYMLLKGYDFSDHTVYLDRYTVNSWIEEYVNGTNTVPLNETLLRIMRTGSLNIRYLEENIPLQLMSQIFQTIFGEIRSISPPHKVFNAKTVICRRLLFTNIDYLRGKSEITVDDDCHYIIGVKDYLRIKPEITVEYHNYTESTKFLNFIRKSVTYMSDLLSKIRSGEKIPKRGFTFLGIDCAKIFRSAIMQKNGAIEEKPPVRIVLDWDAISDAESDLAAVTEMMYVPENEQCTETPVANEPEPDTVRSVEDPWQMFQDSLSDPEKRYISSLLGSPDISENLLKEMKTTRTKIEDAINGKSLDHIGDTVIDNGELVNEYLNDIRKMKL